VRGVRVELTGVNSSDAIAVEGSAARYDARNEARNSGPAADLAGDERRCSRGWGAPGYPHGCRDPSAMMTR
jgi:hypothetical protein